MPGYPFQCTECDDEFTLFRSIAERSKPAACPDCGGVAQRLVCAPNLALMSPIRRNAAVRNERSQHEPRISNSKGHTCRSGCGCGGPKSKIADKPLAKTKLGDVKVQKKRNARPWMLGH